MAKPRKVEFKFDERSLATVDELALQNGRESTNRIGERMKPQLRDPDVWYIVDAVCLEQSGKPNKAIGVIHDTIGRLIHKNRIKDLNQMLSDVYVHNLSTDLLLSILVATLPFRDRLEQRDAFIARCIAELKERRVWCDGLTKGLE